MQAGERRFGESEVVRGAEDKRRRNDGPCKDASHSIVDETTEGRDFSSAPSDGARLQRASE